MPPIVYRNKRALLPGKFGNLQPFRNFLQDSQILPLESNRNCPTNLVCRFNLTRKGATTN